MPRVALAAALVECAQDPGPFTLHDEPDDGFPAAPWVAHCVQPNGATLWVFRFRRDGKSHRVTLRKPGAVTADDARAAVLAREKGGGKPLRPPASGPTLLPLGDGRVAVLAPEPIRPQPPELGRVGVTPPD